MNIQSKMIFILAVSAFLLALAGFFIVYQLSRVSAPLEMSIPRNIESLNDAIYLDNLAQSIKYYDEVLTQSARNYAFTADKQWENRYRSVEPELDRIINEAVSKGDNTEKVFFSTVEKANLELVQLEYESIDFVNEGRSAEAVQILESKEYWDNKAIYKQGLDAYITARGTAYTIESDLARKTLALANTQEEKSEVLLAQTTQVLLIVIPAAIVTMIIVGLHLLSIIINPMKRLAYAATELAKGNYDTSLGTARKDETGVMALAFDKMRTKLEEKEKMKEEFLSIAAHELRTPLQPILFCADSALAGDMNHKEALQVILNQANRLRKLSSDILDVTKLESGTLMYNMEKVRINEMITKVLAEIAVDKANISIASNLHCTEGLDVVLDVGRITQVLTNIISNAIKYTQEGIITLSTEVDHGTKEVRVIVKDNGRGISSEIMPKLFNKFATTSNMEGISHGTGLGLYLSAKIIEGHKGRIGAENNKNGRGATFWLALPLL